MDNIVFTVLLVLTFLLFAFMVFGLFAIGFLFGYKIEEKFSKKRTQRNLKNMADESKEEKNAKKEWKKFLAYDGSFPDNQNK